jgi:hypothetical protein
MGKEVAHAADTKTSDTMTTREKIPKRFISSSFTLKPGLCFHFRQFQGRIQPETTEFAKIKPPQIGHL